MAVDVLKSKGVPEDRILFLNLIASPEGVTSFAKRFPRLRVVTAFVDQGLDDKKCVPSIHPRMSRIDSLNQLYHSWTWGFWRPLLYFLILYITGKWFAGAKQHVDCNIQLPMVLKSSPGIPGYKARSIVFGTMHPRNQITTLYHCSQRFLKAPLSNVNRQKWRSTSHWLA